MKSEAIRELEQMANCTLEKRYPRTPKHYLPLAKYSDKTANGLTKCILDFLKYSGHFAQRLNTTGIPVDQRKTFVDAVGNMRTIGNITWRKSNTELGASDIIANIAGKFIAIEVKMKDLQSENQKKYQEKIESSGGIYLIIRSFEEFYRWYYSYMNQ